MIKRYFSALTNKNFRIFWFCQIISLIGSWMQSISIPWLVYSLTKSPFLLGLVSSLQFMPVLLFSLFSGVIIDKFNKRMLLIITQSILTLMAFIISALVFVNKIQYWHFLVIVAVIGITNTVDMQLRQTIVMEMVGRDKLMNAIGLNSAIFNGARIVGPAVAGVIMAAMGISYCFFINFLSFIPLIISLVFFVRPQFSKKFISKNNIFKDIAEGIKYIISENILFKTLSAVLVCGIFAMNYNVLVPVFAKKILELEASGFGMLMSCIGIGALTGAVIIAGRSKRGPDKNILFISPIIVSFVYISIGFTSNIIIGAVLLVMVGFFNTVFFTTANSTIQLNSQDQFRSRAISVYTLMFTGASSLGSLYSGKITEKFGIRYGYIGNGAMILILICLIFLIIRNNSKKTIQTLQ